MRKLALAFGSTLALAGCATASEKDWRAGADAVAFDDAASQCRGQRAMAADAKAGKAAFTLCMSAKGWRRR